MKNLPKEGMKNSKISNYCREILKNISHFLMYLLLIHLYKFSQETNNNIEEFQQRKEEVETKNIELEQENEDIEREIKGYKTQVHQVEKDILEYMDRTLKTEHHQEIYQLQKQISSLKNQNEEIKK